tara:strand:+ start:1648 stop:2016 length:369 start_codon:yes stop_codon:yes gene_type:complete
MDNQELWVRALAEHNSGEYLEAHEVFEDLWLEIDDRVEKDVVQTFAQADALAVHLQTGNLDAAQRLMRQLPELSQNFPDNYRGTNLKEYRRWLESMISQIPKFGVVPQIQNKEPPKLLDSRQ